jgi:alpha,alpha-trehalase
VETAREGRDRWLALNDRVFRETGKLMEKYNVVNDHLTAGGGEYPNQDGFGWTNGVYLALNAERQSELN